MSDTERDLRAASALLSAHEDYRVLRRFQPHSFYRDSIAERVSASDLKTGLYVDCETTGLDTASVPIIELAILPFTFDRAGNVYGVGAGQSWFNDPGVPIPPEITALTGITDADVAGQRLHDGEITEAIDRAALIIAHNAGFDRPIMERYYASLAANPWACSFRDVPWPAFGCACQKLPHLMIEACGEFYSAHRALDDCRAGLHVLATAQHEDRSALSYLLESARTPTNRVWAMGAPFEVKDLLKARGYRWSDGSGGKRKAWYRDVTPAAANDEIAWLSVEAHARPTITTLTAVDRYSARADG